MKIHQISHVIFETVVMRDNSSLFFLAETLYGLGKCDSAKIQRLLIAHMKFHQLCAFRGSFYWKYIKFQLKKSKGVMSYDTEE